MVALDNESEEDSYESCTSTCIPFDLNEDSARRADPVTISDVLVHRQPDSGLNKPHKANDVGWDAIQAIRARNDSVGVSHFKLLRRLGCGDVGSVYLCNLRGTNCYFAMKVMDTKALATRKKLSRAQTEKEILECLDHPFLPTLYAHFDTAQFSCLVMEYCSGGDLHTLRQKQHGMCFREMAAKFYAAEVLLALEYLHMMGVVYRDLKPENVLVREDGHIMLSDFDLSLRCAVSPTIVISLSSLPSRTERRPPIEACASVMTQSCVPVMGQRLCRTRGRKKTESSPGPVSVPELVVEPTEVRSMSFVGTHEYLAPEIILGDGHGSSVDWWTFGIFLYELLYGETPFKGADNELTFTNVVSNPLEFPSRCDSLAVSEAARDLIRGLLVKDPMKRLGSTRGAGEIKCHRFFDGVNWALIRCTLPPEVPKSYRSDQLGAVGDVPTPRHALEEERATWSPKLGNSTLPEFEFF